MIASLLENESYEQNMRIYGMEEKKYWKAEISHKIGSRKRFFSNPEPSNRWEYIFKKPASSPGGDHQSYFQFKYVFCNIFVQLPNNYTTSRALD